MNGGDYIDEIKNLQRTIKTDTKNYKENLNGNTTKVESTIRKNLEEYRVKITKLLDDYKKNKLNLPDKEYTRRVNEIQDYRQLYSDLFNDFDAILSSKYGFVIIT